MSWALAKRQVCGATQDAGFGPPAGSGSGLLDVLAPMLDTNRDGSVLDDVMGMVGKALGGRQ